MRRRVFLACAAASLAGCGSGGPADGRTPTQPSGTDVGNPGRETGTSSPGTVAPDTGNPSPAETDTTSETPSPEPMTVPATSETDANGTRTGTGETPTPTLTPPPALEGYRTTQVRVTTPDGEHLGAVRAAVADTPHLRYTGLSNVETLPATWGMLFVYESVGDHTYVMRDMDFGIDIVFADDEGAITSIHHAPAPEPDEDGGDQHYQGRGQYVLEVTYEWTADHGVETGDVLRFDL